jgi:hypothetical protein
MTLNDRSLEDDLQISALSRQAPRIWRLWTRNTRLLVACVALVVTVASVVVGVTLRAQPTPSQPSACSAALTTSILSELPSIGIVSYADSTIVLINEQAALNAADQQMAPGMKNAASCLVVRVLRIQTGQMPLISEQNIWAIAYHIPARRSGPMGTTVVPFDVWSFVDASNGIYISSANALTPE